MAYKLYLISILFFVCSLAFSQSPILDSLFKVSKNQKSKELISTYNEISWEFKNSNLDSSFFYARKALKIAQKLKNLNAIAASYNSLANAFDAGGAIDSAVYYHNKSLELRLQTNDLIGAADSYNNLGIVHDLKGDYNIALEHYFKALKIYENQEVSYDKVPMVLGNIGIVYKKQKEYKKVLSYYSRALKIYEDHNYTFGIAVTKGNIGALSLNLNEFQNTIKYSEEAEALYTQLGYLRYVPYMLTNIAIARDSLKQFNLAQVLYKRAITLFKQDQNQFELTYAKLGLGDSYYKQKKLNDALNEINEALDISLLNGYKEFEVRAYNSLSKIEASKGNFKQAYVNSLKYSIGKDSLFEESKTKTIFELEAKYQSEKKQKEISNQRAEIAESNLNLNKKKSQVKSLLLLAIAIALLGYLLLKQQKLKNKQIQKESELKQALVKIESQNKLQEQRIEISRDLHDNIGAQLTFIISTLDNIQYGMKITNNKLNEKLSDIGAFAKDTIYELRDTIWAMNKSKITLDDLQSRISNFIDKAGKTSKRTKFSFTIDKALSGITFTSVVGMNLYRIIQEAINNAIKYADAKSISVVVDTKGVLLEILIIDNGIGFEMATAKKGNGLNNMKKRANEINAQIIIESKPKMGTKIKVTKSLSDEN
ncbi:tetratricopeptide repeat protein [Geojedonia litorea]|uniref:histidine kinase n=1 Tax=Geojedonia litorea TaxID=1268269 RepID=A0ABV9N5R4_9FLAO